VTTELANQSIAPI